MQWLESKLVESWRTAWKWLSVQFMALALLLEGAADVIKEGWAGIPEDVKASVPIWIHSGATAAIFLALVFRFYKQKKKDA